MGLRKKLIRGERGQALVEFSFICAILLMLAGGVADGVTVMRCQIALSGAATEVVNRIPAITLSEVEINSLCDEVININFRNNLGDGNTTYSCATDIKIIGPVAVDMPYRYHDEEYGEWQGNRAYVPVTVTLERDQVLLTPLGQLVFGDPGNSGRRHMSVTAQTRIYMD